MNTHELRKDLISYGMSHAAADELAQKYHAAERKGETVKRAHDWDFVLYPLKMQVRALQSSKLRWSVDVHRQPVYSAYLALLIKARDKIAALRTLNAGEKTIPEVATELALPLQGMRWTAYIPEHVKNKHVLAFDTLYGTTLPHAAALAGKQGQGMLDTYAIGKRIIPFSTKTERTVSDTRWDSIYKTLVMEREGRTGRGSDGVTVYVEALDEAIKAIHNRGLTDEAPYAGKWERLLTPSMRERLIDWQIETTNGLDAGKMQEAQRTQQTERRAQLDAKADALKKKQKEYSEKYRMQKKQKKGSVVAEGHVPHSGREEVMPSAPRGWL